MNYKKLKDKVYKYDTEHEEGFTVDEVKTLLKEFPDINKNKFHDAMRGVTCLFKNNEIVIYYHCDIFAALKCGIEDRELRLYEWD